MQFFVSYCGQATVTGEGDHAEALADHLDVVMDHLMEAEASDPTISDADVSATLATGEVEFTIIVTAESPAEAAKNGIVIIRAAIHAAEGYTPGWEDAHDHAWVMEYRGSSQRPADLVDV